MARRAGQNSRPPRLCNLSCFAVVAVLAFVFHPTLALSADESQPVEAIRAQEEIPFDQLLDVGIQILDPGLGDKAESDLEEKGVYAEVRRSEARFFPVILANTLQETGYWGAVRVVPAGTSYLDLTVRGRIMESSGLKLSLQIQASDSTGRLWLDKRYKETADTFAYDQKAYEPRDPFQNIYNRIANDLLATRPWSEKDALRIRRVTEMRFAADMAPGVFSENLRRDRKGRYEVDRLPADGDPMVARLADIRERDYMLVDALHDHYLEFQQKMTESYVNWRLYSFEEERALRQLRREKWAKRIGGGLAILGGILSDGGSDAERVAQQGAVVAGQILIESSIRTAAEAKIHRAAIEELAASFDAEVEPLVIEVEGETLKLTGSAETQYEEWRRLLRELWDSETGAPLDPNFDTGSRPSMPAEES